MSVLAAILLVAMPLASDVDDLSRSVAVVETFDGHGTGFLVDDTTVMTAAHVAGSGQVTVHFGETEILGEVVADDQGNDLALIQLERDPGLDPLPIASEPPRLGEDVLAIGAPTGSLTVTRGIVSAVFDDGGIQTDASVNPGNSGGPLLRPGGEVLGVVTMKADAEGIGFATGTDAMNDLLGKDRATPPPSGDSNEGAPADPGVEPDGSALPAQPETIPITNSIPVAVPLGASAAVVLAAITILALRVRSIRGAKASTDFEVRLGPTHDRSGG